MAEKCGAIGALTVGGRVVGAIRCGLDAGHEERIPLWMPSVPVEDRRTDRVAPVDWIPGTPHRAILEWAPEAEPDLDLFDPRERFDAEVPMPADETSDPHCPHTSVGVCFRCAVHA